ncbi:MAG TPA: hypothetical protein VGR37_09295 [Longimicrobiaceae bacterium]|nr:hypothetical protein [Longimicrobiaceae bacterium]
MSKRLPRCGHVWIGALAILAIPSLPGVLSGQNCERVINAEVVALDQAIFYNRLGAHDPAGMMFALSNDIVPISGTSLEAGNVRLRDGKRPRPLTLRMNVGDCLHLMLWNLLSSPAKDNQPATRNLLLHAMGMQPVNSIDDDGSFVGKNSTNNVAMVNDGGSYTFYAEREGTFLLYNTLQTTGGDGDGGTISKGLFGAINVEPRGAEWYRSQLTAEEMSLATAKDANGNPLRTPAGHPVINFDAIYPAGHPRAGLPILKMLTDNNAMIVHADLTAIITGPNKGNFPAGTYPQVVVNRDRHRPFREVTVIFHDEPGLIQAFNNIFDDPRFEHTLHSGRDAFAINYGTGGIGAEVLGNRFGVGPMADCVECKYEEFFLSSWAVGDPAMLVDVPADFDGDGDGKPDPGRKATKALHPEDPSNVYHSYMGDHLKIRNLHAGPKEHHIFHLHAHQWLHSPNSDNSTYLDSQAIGPGGGFTYEITYDGGGNRNKTPGDAIFHCHFYPHFAQGMWALWRVHDTFESGTVLGTDGRPAAGARALPDGEIQAGTPIPAVVPLPGYALAPMPTASQPGFPFYIPGVAGHRPPKPPLDTRFDGGLPRHVVRNGTASFPKLNTLDFHKENKTLVVDSLPEDGTALEKAAMSFHASRQHATYTVDPVTLAVGSGSFITNGRPGVAGAPFADPCVSDQGAAIGNPRTYKGASFQLDAKINKAGWHFPQHRMFGLWDDVNSFISGQKAPEPMFIRANTNDCVTYHLVNLIPHEYQLDDFQVRTPTDVIGQHIHLVKFDVTASDGAANGFNYEDGSLSPGEVRERIHAIRVQNQCQSNDSRNGSFACPLAKAHPFFGAGPNNEWVGAQETIQRWYVDDVLNAQGKDRTLRTVFTHDHFGPSTHQQAGLYAGLVTEPQGSSWRDPETGATFGGRHDGGPTSWRADIITANPDSSYREFNVQVADFTLAYTAEANLQPRLITDPITGHLTMGMADPANAINPPGRFEPSPVLPDLLRPPVAKACPNGAAPPCPELVSADEPGTMTVNYRNEPIALRVRNPSTNTQATGTAGDLSFVFQSRTDRADSRFNVQPTFYPALTGGVGAGDPFTPLIRAKEGDRIQLRILVGAHEEGHNFSVHSPRWLFEPADANSGFRNSQTMGISEHYEFVLPPLPKNYVGSQADYLYKAGSSTDDLWNGLWGLMRVYVRGDGGLLNLPNNSGGNFRVKNAADFNGICLKTAPVRTHDITAVTARDALPGGTLVYNSRTGMRGEGPLHDPTAILYVRTNDLDMQGKLRAGAPIEPLVVRANAGECIQVTLRNRLPAVLPDLQGYSTLPMIVDRFNANHLAPSSHVGLHPQLLSTDVTRGDGTNVGTNPMIQTAAPGDSVKYQWYAGDLVLQPDNSLLATPVEFGATNLTSSDPIKHSNKGAIGALIIEPQGSSWREGESSDTLSTSRAFAWVSPPGGESFQEFVLLYQDDVNLRYGNGAPVENLADAEDPEDSGQKAFNYRTEPLWFRMGYAPNTPLEQTRTFQYTEVMSNWYGDYGDPQTPLLTVGVGKPVRLRILQPGGHQRNHIFQLHGHIWEELPYTNGSKALGSNPLSEWKGSSNAHGPTNHFDVLLKNGAGGKFGIVGDYLYRDQPSFQFDGGLWGIVRVAPLFWYCEPYDPAAEKPYCYLK